MVALNLVELAEKMGGRILQGSPSQIFSRFNIDSRTVAAGELFFAIQAERDGHDFITHAQQNGAAGAVISHNSVNIAPDMALIKVKDTLAALQELARAVLRDSGVQIIGITGSAGKTTTKEFTAALLAGRFNILKSAGNYNNHIGLPLSLLQLQPQNDVAVLEYGMSGRGEIATLTGIASPDIAVITNIHPVHLEFFSDLEEIALAKKEILEGMNPKGYAVLNGENEHVRRISQNWEGQKLFFGTCEQSMVSAQNIRDVNWAGMTIDLKYGDESASITLPFFNRGLLSNFLAAAATAHILEIPLEEVVLRAKNLRTFAHRCTLLELQQGIKVIDDSYNSNPAALDLALESLKALQGGRKVAVLGDMLELGEKAPEYHYQSGEKAARSGLDLLITIGPLAYRIAAGARSAGLKSERINSYQDTKEASAAIINLIKKNDIVLVKGSRGIGVDKLITILKKRG